VALRLLLPIDSWPASAQCCCCTTARQQPSRIPLGLRSSTIDTWKIYYTPGMQSIPARNECFTTHQIGREANAESRVGATGGRVRDSAQGSSPINMQRTRAFVIGCDPSMFAWTGDTSQFLAFPPGLTGGCKQSQPFPSLDCVHTSVDQPRTGSAALTFRARFLWKIAPMYYRVS
jgi:hypothetical protein